MLQLRSHKTQALCSSGRFNTSSLNEIIVHYDDAADSDSIGNFDVLLTSGPRAGQWVSLRDAFKQHDVISDNYHTSFFEPPTDADRKRGYTL